MASSHKTEHYGLSQFAPLDRPAWLVDYNTDMEKIDTALHNLDETGGGSGTLDQTARDMAQAAQDAAKDAQEMATAAQATADEALEKAEEALNNQGTITGDITNINEEITQIKNDVNTAQSTATTANETAEEALTLAQGCVKRSGDTMTGVLKLAGNPVDDADAANKGYVDSLAGNPFPDVPFTDDRWNFLGELKDGQTSISNVKFARLPREIMVVIDATLPNDYSTNISLSISEEDPILCFYRSNVRTAMAMSFQFVSWMEISGGYKGYSQYTISGSTNGISVTTELATNINVEYSNYTGSFKFYWR